MAGIQGLPIGLKLNFSGEREVYGKAAYADGFIPHYLPGCSYIMVVNTGVLGITLLPGARGTVAEAGIINEVAVAFAGIPLSPADTDGFGGGFWVFDAATNHVTINTLRAIVHGAGEGQLSIWAV